MTRCCTIHRIRHKGLYLVPHLCLRRIRWLHLRKSGRFRKSLFLTYNNHIPLNRHPYNILLRSHTRHTALPDLLLIHLHNHMIHSHTTHIVNYIHHMDLVPHQYLNNFHLLHLRKSGMYRKSHLLQYYNIRKWIHLYRCNRLFRIQMHHTGFPGQSIRQHNRSFRIGRLHRFH